MSRLVEVFCATQRHQKTKNKKNETQTKVRMALLCEALFQKRSISRLLSWLVTPMVTLPLEPSVLNVLPITGLAVATAPPTA